MILSGRGGEILEEAECVCPAVHHLVEPSSTSQLTYQQFINCAYLEILPFYVSLVSVVPVPCTCTRYLYVPYYGHVSGHRTNRDHGSL